VTSVPDDRGPAKGGGGDDSAPGGPATLRVDEREQLVNERTCGPIEAVSLPAGMITSLHAILLDFDPSRLAKAAGAAAGRFDPTQFYQRVVRPWLGRHPVFDAAEVRSSGRGLHGLVRLEPAVELRTEADQYKWAAVVEVVQRLLPTDPDCPGITALTRPVGSVNGKSRTKVTLLKEGRGVKPEAVLALCGEAGRRPFGLVAGLLFGGDRVTPCPVCKGRGSRLDCLDREGRCYGRCGTVDLGRLFDVFLKPRPSPRGGRTRG